LHIKLRALLFATSPAPLRDFLDRAFKDLARLLGYLDVLENTLGTGGSSDEARQLFSVVHAEALSLSGFLESQRTEAHVDGALAAALDTVTFAVRHELRRVFEHELHPEEGADERALLTDAHELLRNCFQQVTVILAHALDPSIEEVTLFGASEERRAKSLQLCADLADLLRVTQQAERECNHPSVSAFAQRLAEFRAGSMRHLMQKDWVTIENFVEQIPALRKEGEIKDFLHRFRCYLEVLLGHVKMRSVLAA
jgi:hypothetical protein